MFVVRRARRAAVAALAATTVATLVTSAVPAAASSRHSDVAAALAALKKYTAMPKFVPPNGHFQTAKLKGKTVALVAIDQTTPALVYDVKGAEQAAAAVGLKTRVFDGKDTPSLMTEGLQQAISQHSAAIVLVGIPVGLEAKQIAAAAKAGIPVVNVENNEPKIHAAGQGAGPHIYASASEDMKLEGELAADQAIVHTGGKVKAVIMDTPGLTPGPPIVAGFKAALARCKGCSVVTTTQTQIQDWATGLSSQTESTLNANPTANVLLPIFDTMALFIVPAVKQAGAAGRVTVNSTSAFPAATRMMKSYPTVLTGLIGQSDYWAGWLAINQAMRGMLHLKPGNPVVPSRWITPALVKKVGTSEKALYGNSYVSGFKKLWGQK